MCACVCALVSVCERVRARADFVYGRSQDHVNCTFSCQDPATTLGGRSWMPEWSNHAQTPELLCNIGRQPANFLFFSSQLLGSLRSSLTDALRSLLSDALRLRRSPTLYLPASHDDHDGYASLRTPFPAPHLHTYGHAGTSPLPCLIHVLGVL